ncbi:E3 ubiquitin-protein ligase MARCH6 [Eurytemora carolleeae]|uniref:E3 ubiquitin-protein ligase MARCH6 n=1 Tax=Eurytemora carolleeae TaxID=1294199 RepID=UPI000C76BAA4|nr:E3 ubiquitin-protein ligase MARCH6 [Eurytemora carolleeae]|eukprot:XP_023333010.1 E3 ubiquitin-protein ligase MARCH6-like [Eurytemora affinis]
MDDSSSGDICRVCRCEGTPDRPLFHPCICTGSIKFIHQECLVQWLRYSKKEFCELCNYRFSFTPIYSPDMPKRIPIRLVFSGVLGTVMKAVKFWLHYTLVAAAWLGVVPLTACRIYRTLFTGSVSSIFSLPVSVFTTDNIVADILLGSAVVTLTLLTFIGLVWLREQILHGGGPAWLEAEAAVPLEPVPNLPHVPAVGEEALEGEEDGGWNPPLGGDNLPVEPPAPEIQDPAGEGEEQQWNPMEWDRAAEELTWERLLGLDGSLVFLEHVFWVVSLYIQGLLITMVGYCMIGLCLIVFHTVTCFLGFRKVSRALGLCYVVVKVALLLVAEILVFPVLCGWWLDICSLSLFDATLKDRFTSFTSTPWASVFIHWLVGMVYVFYFASFVILLREVLRPGVLWFLRNLNDPDFNPIQEMIHLPLIRHIRRFCASLVMFGSSIFVMLYCPSRIIKSLLPSFLPYTTQTNEGSVDEISMELLLLLVFLPAIQDQNHTREWLKWFVQQWCTLVSWILDIRSYMFGDVPLQGEGGAEVDGVEHPAEEDEADEFHQAPREQEDAEEEQRGLGAAHQVQPGLGAAHQVKPGLAHQVQPDLGAAHQVQLGLGAAHQVQPGLGAAHLVQLGLGAAHQVQPGLGAAYQVQPGLGAAHQGKPGLGATHQVQPGLGAAHQALLIRDGPIGFQPYIRPRYFGARISALLSLMVLSWLVISLFTIVVPVWIGRQVGVDKTAKDKKRNKLSVHMKEFLLISRAVALFTGWLRQGWTAFGQKMKEWAIIGGKAVLAFILLLDLIPFMFGVLLDLVVLTPVRVPLHQSPIYFLWQDWFLGLMYTKITVALTFMGPDWWLKLSIEQLYQDGIRNMNLTNVIMNLVVPCVTRLGLALAVPYVISHGILPLVLTDTHILINVQRRIYPFLLLTLLFVFLLVLQFKQITKLIEHIKNDRYLVGRRLVNYNHKISTEATS